jgi:hypothetical protein
MERADEILRARFIFEQACIHSNPPLQRRHPARTDLSTLWSIELEALDFDP